jgi:hypothetical protein
MSGRWLVALATTVWVALAGPALGFVVGQRYSGADCRLSPTFVPDIVSTLSRGVNAVTGWQKTLQIPNPIDGGLRMLSDPSMWALALLVPFLALAAWWWWRERAQPPKPPQPDTVLPLSIEAPHVAPKPQWGREWKLAVGSAGIKSAVREGRIEEAYQVRSVSETAFEAYADFDKQQERVALTNRLAGPGFLVLSETLEAHSPLSEGLGNRPPPEVWSIREEWMPAVSGFVRESALSLRSMGVWPARITADLSAGGHGVPGLFALSEAANEFPRTDRHARFIVPEGDVERLECLRLLDALRTGDLALGAHSQPMPWKERLPLALTTALRDNQRGREDLDEVAAHIAPALTARVRFETGTSENLTNLMRRLIKHGPHSASEPCPLTFDYTSNAVPISSAGTVDAASLLPIADNTLRALRSGEGVRSALEVDMGRHLVLVTVPCNTWDDVRRVEQYVLERLEFGGPPDRRRIGIFFSGYRPEDTSREERALALRLGTVHGGWESVYRAIASTRQVVHTIPADRRDGVAQTQEAI